MDSTDWSVANACERAAVVRQDKQDALREGLRKWGKTRRAQAGHRDPLVLGSLDAGISKEEVHVLTGLGRSTIDRIAKSRNLLGED